MIMLLLRAANAALRIGPCTASVRHSKLRSAGGGSDAGELGRRARRRRVV
jgi:hypothetical protein